MDTVDGIALDRDNVEFNQAAELVHSTHKTVFLTGKAGTGKTTFLKHIRDTTQKQTVILAPTGIAAVNAGGQTIHSFFQLKYSPFVADHTCLGTYIKENYKYRKWKIELIEKIELIIIDEISMVRADILDEIDRILRIFRKNYNQPFGGVQMLLIGDVFQLSPILGEDGTYDIVRKYYPSEFFFDSHVIKKQKQNLIHVELKKIYRQKEKDFINVLNRLRVGQTKSEDHELLNSKYSPNFSNSDDSEGYVNLVTTNAKAYELNSHKLDQIESEKLEYKAIINDKFPEKMMPTEEVLELKVGAQVMFIKNGDRYCNGTMGKVSRLEEDSIGVIIENDDKENEVTIERETWENTYYELKEIEENGKKVKKIVEEVRGTFEQYPVRLAWAITVHKSQGMTLDKVVADLEGSFAEGQVYLALSRCTSFSGLVLTSKIDETCIKVNGRAIEFAKNTTPNELITEHLTTGRADLQYKKAATALVKGEIEKAFEHFKNALKFRNDIDTPLFEKFVVTQGKRLFSFKSKFERAKEKIGSKSKEIEGLSNELKAAKERIDRLEDKLKETKQASDTHKKEVKASQDSSPQKDKNQRYQGKIYNINKDKNDKHYGFIERQPKNIFFHSSRAEFDLKGMEGALVSYKIFICPNSNRPMAVNVQLIEENKFTEQGFTREQNFLEKKESNKEEPRELQDSSLQKDKNQRYEGRICNINKDRYDRYYGFIERQPKNIFFHSSKARFNLKGMEGMLVSYKISICPNSNQSTAIDVQLIQKNKATE